MFRYSPGTRVALWELQNDDPEPIWAPLGNLGTMDGSRIRGPLVISYRGSLIGDRPLGIAHPGPFGGSPIPGQSGIAHPGPIGDPGPIWIAGPSRIAYRDLDLF